MFTVGGRLLIVVTSGRPSVHILGVVLVCTSCLYVRSGGGRRYPVVLRVLLHVVRPYSWTTAALNCLRYTTPVHATPPAHPPRIPYVLVRVGAGQGLFFVLAGVGVRFHYRWCWQRGDWWW